MKTESHWISNLAVLTCFAVSIVGLCAIQGCAPIHLHIGEQHKHYPPAPAGSDEKNHDKMVDHMTDSEEAGNLLNWVIGVAVPAIAGTTLLIRARKKRKGK